MEMTHRGVHVADAREPRNMVQWWAGRRSRFGPPAALLMSAGILAAITTDGTLPGMLTKALFGLLIVLDVIVIDWLINPR